MKINHYFAFQTRAISELQTKAVQAHQYYAGSHVPQVISFTAPTGAGKTIMMATMIENVLTGTEQTAEQPDAIFVWLSDSPELNQQSRDKIDQRSDKIRFDQCVTIQEDSFDQETLDEGHIYFLNTQKLSKTSNLTGKGDSRQWSIWETLSNTVEEKGDKLYFIIDEAHRGMRDAGAARATTIMQKFIKGSQQDGLPAMPVVIGMSATSERFNKLISSTISTLQFVTVTPDEVRSSGLLKDKIIFTYPDSTGTSEMAVLEAAATEWKQKCERWQLYCFRRNQTKVNPVFLIQVANGTGDELSATDLDVCLQKITERTGETFEKGQVVHTFGQTMSAVEINGLEVPYAEPSRISDDRMIRVVFYKENLSTGWDCPRAETMMSFRHASDSTYIAQLVGRMVRTPLGQRVMVDDTLNDVHIYLPYFDREKVKEVVDALQSTEGGTLPTEICYDDLNGSSVTVMGAEGTITRRTATHVVGASTQLTIPGLFNYPEEEQSTVAVGEQPIETPVATPQPRTVTVTVPQQHTTHKPTKAVPQQTLTIAYDFEDVPRIDIIRYINNLALSTCHIRNVQVNNYLVSLFAVVRFLRDSKLNRDLYRVVKEEIVELIHNYVLRQKASGQYEQKKNNVLSFKLHSQVFDVFGNAFENKEYNLFATSDINLDLQMRQADAVLGREGIVNDYGRKYFDADHQNNYKVDVVLYSLDESCLYELNDYAKKKFHGINDTYRRATLTLDEMMQKRYSDIIKDGNIVSEVNYLLPELIEIKKAETTEKGDEYNDHLFVDEKTMTARITLNQWEKDVIREERRRSDFVCWLRNPSRGRNSLCLKYMHNGKEEAFYPDFLIVRKEATGYIVDILEPHNPVFDDNVGKAKALATYAKQHYTRLGRVELIRQINNEYRRLNMCEGEIMDAVLQIQTAEELNHLFMTHETHAFPATAQKAKTELHVHNEIVMGNKYVVSHNNNTTLNIHKEE